MHISQKDTCHLCRAIGGNGDKIAACKLGYTIKGYCKPAEPCPKPRTMHELLQAKETMIKQ